MLEVIGMAKAVISPKQFALILFVYLIGGSMVFVPELHFAQKDAWISTLLASLISTLLLALWLHLQRKFPGMSLIQYGIKVLGPWLGYPLGFYLAFIFLVICNLIIEDWVLVTSLVMLPNTPEMVIEFSFILVALYACYKGLESIARLCELAWMPLTFLMLILPFLEWQELGISTFQPIFQINWQGVLTGTVNSLVFPFAEVLIPVVLLPYVTPDKKAERYYLLAPLAAGALLLIRTSLTLMTLGPELANRMTIPVISLFQLVELGMFLNRIEGAFLGIWYLGLVMKLAVTLYVTALALGQLTGVRRLENLWVPLAALLFFGTHIRYPTYSELAFSSLFVLPFLALPGELVYPWILWGVSLVRGWLKPVAVDHFDPGQD